LKRRLFSTPGCALLALGLALALPLPAARAGTYDVYSCWAGSDSFRNPGANASAWGKTSDPGGRYGAFDQCGSSDNGLGVIALSGYTAPNGAAGEVSFGAPEGIRIERVRMWRTSWSYGTGSGGASQRNYLYFLTDGALTGRGDQFDGSADVPLGAAGSSDTAGHGLIPANQLDVDLAGSTPSVISYRVGCRFDAGCPTADGSGGFAAGVKVYGTQVTLRDSSEPALAVASGGLLAPGLHRGTETVRVSSATDNIGIKRLAVFAEGASSPVGVVDYERNPDRCAWWRASPCSNVSDVEIAVDTRRVPDGDHRFVVRAYDAAENVHSFTSDLVTIKNGADAKPDSLGAGLPVVRGALNGVNAAERVVLSASFARNRRGRLVTRYARGAIVSGRLLDEAGHPIVNAEVALDGRVRRGAVMALGVAHTSATGRFRFRLPGRRASRQLFVTYRSHLGDPSPVAARTLALKVAAGVRLAVRPGRVRNGQAITFRGTLLGRPIPASGKLIDMQVKVGRRWQTFATTRARGRRASFVYRYRFTRTRARITYRFRALARAESAYPYATGASPTVKVQVN
jgi:hypothetical protein